MEATVCVHITKFLVQQYYYLTFCTKISMENTPKHEILAAIWLKLCRGARIHALVCVLKLVYISVLTQRAMHWSLCQTSWRRQSEHKWQRTSVQTPSAQSSACSRSLRQSHRHYSYPSPPSTAGLTVTINYIQVHCSSHPATRNYHFHSKFHRPNCHCRCLKTQTSL